jgi:hypothetical protein
MGVVVYKQPLQRRHLASGRYVFAGLCDCCGNVTFVCDVYSTVLCRCSNAYCFSVLSWAALFIVPYIFCYYSHSAYSYARVWLEFSVFLNVFL